MIFNNNTRRKKGEDMLVDFWAILIFVIVLLLFLIIFLLTKGDSKENNLREQFAAKDTEYMLNSFIKSPYMKDGTKTNGEIIVEDYLNNDFSRTVNSFNSFFNGINMSSNNQVGGYAIKIFQGDTEIAYFLLDLKNEKFESQVSNSKFMNMIVTPSGYNGVSAQMASGNNPFPMQIAIATITIPSQDGKDLKVGLAMVYRQEKLSIFE